jgi:nuclear pore complex protein Nup210
LPRSANSLGEPNSLDLESSIGYSLLRGSGRIIAGSKIQTGAVDCIQAKDHSAGRTEIAACLRVAEVGC